MPTYEYKCKTCGKEFEIQQRITEESLKNCPIDICEEKIKGKGEVERMISKNVGLVFKGTGFYLTDYSKKNVSPNTSSETKKSEPQITESTKTETKPSSAKSDKTD